jgi:hypothetical protein
MMNSRLHALEYTRITDSFGIGEHERQMYSSSLLAHLTKNFAPHPENVATEALGHILAHSPSARRGLSSILSGTGVEEDLSYRTQQVEGDALARPDLTGRDAQGRNIVLVEAKFWAGLTDNQPNTYIEMLADNVPSTLCFLVPQERVTSLWPEICNRASDTGFNITMEHDGEYKSASLSGNKHLLMTTWATVLTAIETVATSSGETLTLSDISQLRGLCEEQEAEGFLPIRPGEFGPEAPRRIVGLMSVIDQVINGLAQTKSISLSNLRATPVRSGYRRYFDALPRIIPKRQFGLEYNLDLWRQYEHPIWLRGHREYGELAGRDFEDDERAIPARLIRENSGEIFFRISLPIGAEIDEVVRNITLQVQTILNKFQTLKQQ